MSVLNLWPARVRWCNPDGTLTPEAVRMLEVLCARVGGMMGDTGADVFAAPEGAVHAGLPELLQPPVADPFQEMHPQAAPSDPAPPELVLQGTPYSAGTAIVLADYRFSLEDTAVVPGTYGSAANVAQFTVDQQGRLTMAQSVPIQIDRDQVNGLGTIATENKGTNFTGSFTGKTVTVTNGIITQVV